MACEKYSGWITGAALGALRPDEEREFRAHAGLCADCRSQWEAERALALAVNGAVESLVAGEPSPQFAARLRARIADEPAPAAWPFLTRTVLSAGALAAAAVVLAVLLLRSPERAGRTAETAARNPAAVVKPAQPPAPAILSAGQDRATRSGASRRFSARPQNVAAPFPFEVLVPRGQLSAALLLSEAASAGRIDGAQLSAFAEEAAKPLQVKAIEIAPLEDSGAADSASAGSSPGSDQF
jgi:hypothetical protein